MSAFQTSHQHTPSSLLATASMIVAASKLSFEDDHANVVEFVAQALSRLDANNLRNFVTKGSDPATAAEIVYAALETEASDVDDEATVDPSMSVMTVVTNVAARPDLDVIPTTAMLSMIKEIMLPMTGHMAAQEIKMVEISARLARIEASAALTTGLGTDMVLAG